MMIEYEWKVRQAVKLLDLAGGDIPKASRLADRQGLAIDSAQWRIARLRWLKEQKGERV